MCSYTLSSPTVILVHSYRVILNPIPSNSIGDNGGEGDDVDIDELLTL